MRAGDIAEMERCYAIAWTLAERLDQPYLNWQRANMRAACALLAGDTTEAQARATEALDIGTRSGQPDADVSLSALRSRGVNNQRGVFPDDAMAAIEQARDPMPGNRDWLTAMLACEYARVGRLDGRPGTARRVRGERLSGADPNQAAGSSP